MASKPLKTRVITPVFPLSLMPSTECLFQGCTKQGMCRYFGQVSALMVASTPDVNSILRWGRLKGEPMTKLDRYRMLNTLDRLRGVPAFVGAVCLLLSGDSILGRLSILAAKTQLEMTSHQSALNAAVVGLALLGAGCTLEPVLLLIGGWSVVWSPTIRWLRCTAGILLTLGSFLFISSILNAQAVFTEIAMSPRAPRLEDVANLTSSGATVVSVGSICVLLSTALTVVVSQSQNIRPIVMPASRANGVRKALVAVFVLMFAGLLLLAVLLYTSNQSVGMVDGRVSAAELADDLGSILQFSRWFFMGLAVCGVLQALLPVVVAVSSTVLPDDDCTHD